MSFNALSNVARRKNKVEKNSKKYNLYKSGRKGCYSFKYSHPPPPPPQPFFNVGTSQITCALKSTVTYKIRLIFFIWERHLTMGKYAERTKLDFRCPIFPLTHWSSQLFDLPAPSSTDVPFLLLNQPIVAGGGVGRDNYKRWRVSTLYNTFDDDRSEDDCVCFSNRVHIFY